MPPECLYSGEKALYIEWRSGKAAAEKEQPELRGPRSGSKRPEETEKNRRRQAEYREREPRRQAAANRAAGGNGEIRYKQKYNCGPAK